jgi:hypothetical protein
VAALAGAAADHADARRGECAGGTCARTPRASYQPCQLRAAVSRTFLARNVLSTGGIPKTKTTTDAAESSDPLAELARRITGLDDDRQRRYAEAVQEAKTNPLDVAPPGGRYTVGGVIVDANGMPITGEGETPP